jgi:hypothetical protein
MRSKSKIKDKTSGGDKISTNQQKGKDPFQEDVLWHIDCLRIYSPTNHPMPARITHTVKLFDQLKIENWVIMLLPPYICSGKEQAWCPTNS